MSALHQAVERHGVVVHTLANIESMDSANRVIHVSNNMIGYRGLVWTAPLPLLAKLLRPDMSWERPLFVPTRLYHFDLSCSPRSDLHYLYMNSPDMESFWVTLYGNITGNRNDNRITVEAVDYDCLSKEGKIIDELIEAKIVPSDVQIQCSFTQFLTNGFPVIANSYHAQNQRAADTIARHPEIICVGRGGGEAFYERCTV